MVFSKFAVGFLVVVAFITGCIANDVKRVKADIPGQLRIIYQSDENISTFFTIIEFKGQTFILNKEGGVQRVD